MSNNINVHQDANDNSTSSTEKKFELLVVGAGIAGLSFVYGLRRSELYREGKVGYKIVERRDGPGTDLGYPIHLSSAARKSLESMFSPPDLEKLHHARSKIPVYHDGITVSSYRGKKAWRTVREPGTRPMIEREELMEILRGGVGVGEVEYGLEVVSHSQKEGGVEVKLKGREGRREEVKVDLVVGADGMFSQTRQSLLPHTEVLEKLPWTIINSRTSSSEVLRWLKDPHGINTIYGDSFSATMIPLSSGVNLGNEVGADGDKHVLSPVVEEGPNDGMKPDDEGRKEDGSITQNDDITVNDHQGIKLINGIERTTPKSNTDNTTEHIPEEPSTDHPKSSNPDNLSTNPITTPKEISQVYVALTVPSKWLSPSYCHQMSKCTCEPTIHSLFLRNLENSDGWGRRKGYQMYSMRRTFAGRGRVVLLGDAGHGMPPFCGAGAGSAVVDSIELVRELERGLDNIDYTLQEFRTQSQSRNDPLIKESNRLLWLAQGETELSMLARKVVFWGLEMGEVFSGKRRKLEEQLRKSIEEDESKGMR